MSPSELRAAGNPRYWRFTWETQSQIPNLRLFLFNPDVNPSTQCTGIKVDLVMAQSLLMVSFSEGDVDISLKVPIPRVLIDAESSVNVRALDDHIEVKMVLLLSVDHPLVSNFDAVLNLSEEDGNSAQKAFMDEFDPRSEDSDLKNLSSSYGVHFYCRNCLTKLTRSLRFFEEMPSVNWREVADNWFGSCCCSFGGISEKLVTSYANAYTCASGVCLFSTTTVVICKDDLLGCIFPDWDANRNCLPEVNHDSGHYVTEVDTKLVANDSSANQSQKMQDANGKASCSFPKEDKPDSKLEDEVVETVDNDCNISDMFSAMEITKSLPTLTGFGTNTRYHIQHHDPECCTHSSSETSIGERKPGTEIELQACKKSFLNGFLGNAFMERSSNLSKDVQWIEFLCPQCSCLLGAYPCINGRSPFDNGVRLFKCYISTSLPVGGSSDFFRNYTLERMFTSQLLESAKDELSFRTVVRDLQTKSPMMQIVLLNPNSWCCSGYCLCTKDPVGRIDMYPIIKVLFSDSSKSTEFQLRNVEEWVKKNQVDEVYMLESQTKEVIKTLESANMGCLPSNEFIPGFSLSSLRR